jgi:hypothetical protein
MTARRQPLRLCTDWEPLFPVQALFNAIGDDGFLDVVKHLLNRQGYSSDYCHCHFPADLDPQEPTFNGVLFSHFDDVIVVTETQFADVLDTVLASYQSVDPAGADTLTKHLVEFRQSISEPRHKIAQGTIRMTETSTYGDVIDLAGIERNWPDGRQVPKLMAPWPNGSFGYARFSSTRFDDYWIELGGELNEQFGIFMKLPEGTNIAVWFHDGAVRDAEPVIELGSEGELHVLAPNLKSFFAMWADGTLAKSSVAFHELIETDAETTPEEKAQRPIFAAQMRALVAQAPGHAPGVPAPNLTNFMEHWGTTARAKIAADPLMQSISKLLDADIPIRPVGSDPATTYVFPAFYQVRIAGARVDIQTAALPPDYTTFAPLPEKDALIPLLLQVREARARANPGRGLWHSAVLELYEDRTAVLKASWEFEPEFREGGRMTKAEFEADLARFPKSPRWREPWMDELA